MARARTEKLLKVTTWPIDVLRASAGGQVVGLLMPSIAGQKPIHELYNPKSRLAEFPDTNWPFLLRSAANLARAFDVVHEHGHIIGDVNHGNAVVSPRAIVVLIDCDSFQAKLDGRWYPCEVGVPEYQPPELQALSSYRGVIRTVEHDRFGLAVMLFQLLLLGRHPFAGRFLAAGDMPIDRAIRERRFAYGAWAPSRQMAPPPAVPAIDVLSSPIAALFEQAFTTMTGARPSAAEWVRGLSKLENELHTCAANPGHAYYSRLSSCPWCDFEARIGKVLFVVTLTFQSSGAASTGSPFNLEVIWAELVSVPAPGSTPALPSPVSIGARPNPIYLRDRRIRQVRKRLSLGLLAISIVLWLASAGTTGGASFVWCVIGGPAAFVVWPRSTATRVKVKLKLDAARADWEQLAGRWRSEASDSAFEQKRRELEGARQQYLDLPNERARRMKQLEASVREKQLIHFLDQHRLGNAKAKSIGDGRLAVLNSWGIETAADVTSSAVIAIPGFGPALTQSLLDWRRSVEIKFRFDANRGIDSRDRQTVESEIRATQLRLEATLGNGADQLRQAAQLVESKRKALKPLIDKSVPKVAQAEADWATF